MVSAKRKRQERQEKDGESSAPAAGQAIEADSNERADDGATTAPASRRSESQKNKTWTELGLDERLLQAVAKEGWEEPTQVQQRFIQLALEGKDIIARSSTGSGKTAAYLLSVLNKMLASKSTGSARVLVLVPTRELAQQTLSATESLCAYTKDISVAKLDEKQAEALRRLAVASDLVVATPAQAWKAIESGILATESVKQLVLDESDLLTSYGYKEETESIGNTLKGRQTMLLSATLSADLAALKGMTRDPVLLDLEEQGSTSQLRSYYVLCDEREKFIILYLIFKLTLLKGKSIVFTNSIDRCYRLKLFLETFGIRSCILNSELPVNSRLHVVQEFNAGVYDILIAADDHEILEGEEKTEEAKEGLEAKTASERAERPAKRIRRKHDAEFGVSRGIDFKAVAAVINFDLPQTSRSYLHRIGRTARAGRAGLALSFVVRKTDFHKHKAISCPTGKDDEKVLARIRRKQADLGQELDEYHFSMDEVKRFEYRVTDALRAITSTAIREARTLELRRELIQSEKLQRHFAENPAELRALRHDGESRSNRQLLHLKNVPSYLLPQGKANLTQDVGFVPFKKESKKHRFRKGGKAGKVFKRKTDPLKTFKARRKTK